MPNITADSFNIDLRQKVVNVVVNGYGGTMTSTAIVRDGATNLYPLVDDAQWDPLRLDILAARTHQLGVAGSLSEVNVSDLISTTVFDEYLTLVNQLVLDSGMVAIGQYQDVVPTLLVNPTLPLSFGGTAYHRTTVTFLSAAKANEFFNSGGAFIFSFGFTPSVYGPSGAQSRIFQELSSQMAQRIFGLTQWRAAGPSYTNWTTPTVSADTAYGGNLIRFRAALNTSNYVNAQVLTFEVFLLSTYTTTGPSGAGAGSISYGDQVIGSANIDIVQRRSYINNASPVTTETWNYDANWTISGVAVTYP